MKQNTSTISLIKSPLTKGILLLLMMFLYASASAQITKVRGKVTDGVTGEAMPFVNVYFKGTTIGTTTDLNGFYSLESRQAADSVAVSSVGYISAVKLIQRNKFQEVNFQLTPDQISLSEVVIRAGENPAEILLRKVIANKPLHNSDKLDYTQYEAYTKIAFDANNITEKFKNRKILKPFEFIFDYVDTSSISGKTYLPVFLSETVSDVYYRSNPKARREVI